MSDKNENACPRCANVPTYGTFLACCWRDRDHFPAERRALWFGFIAAIAIGILTYVAYWAFLVDVPGFRERVGTQLPYVVLATVAVAMAVWHLKAVRRELGEMVAMMIGMTFGMVGGFLAGYLVSATNGMFTGSVVGILAGCALGWYVGDCCGMFGRMEGLMAGLMAGIMGAMTAVMLLNDRLTWFTPFLVLVCLVILSGLTYLVHKEHRDRQGVDVVFRAWGIPAFLVACFVGVAVLVAVMSWGPKSILFLGF